jgi:hypothetical protein
MMSDRDPNRIPMADAALDALLAHAADRPPGPLPDRLRARLLAEALQAMPPTAPRPAAGNKRPAGWLSQLWQGMGGAPGLAGLTAAGVAGLWIGAAEPDPVAGVASAFWQGAGLLGAEPGAWSDDALAGLEPDPLLALLGDD